MVLRFAARCVEELAPFFQYYRATRKLLEKCSQKDILLREEFSPYTRLDDATLAERLEDERDRAVALDEKTFKFTMSFTVTFAVFALAVSLVIRGDYSEYVIVAAAPGVFYLFGAGFLALGAMKTLPSYGYGTHFKLLVKERGVEALAEALARQETMNLVRQVRNETSFMAARNGFILIGVGLVVLLFAAIGEVPWLKEMMQGPQVPNRCWTFIYWNVHEAGTVG